MYLEWLFNGWVEGPDWRLRTGKDRKFLRRFGLHLVSYKFLQCLFGCFYRFILVGSACRRFDPDG